MPPTRMLVNGVDLSEFGLWVETPAGLGDAPERQDEVIETRGAGGLLSPEAARVRPREWSVTATLIAPTVDDARDMWDLCKLHLADAWLEVIFAPWPDRMIVCRYQSAAISGWQAALPGFRVTLRLLAPNPYLVAPVVDSYGLAAGGEVALVLGTAPSPYLVRFVGPAAVPTLLYTDANGRVRGNLSLAGNLVAGEWLEFDSATLRIERHTETGTVINGAPFVATTTSLFALDPMDGTPDAAPTLSLDFGSAVVYVRKAWR